jgi:hypothetical protein
MAKVLPPFDPPDRNGAVDKTVVYYKWKELHCAREYVVPFDPKTPQQKAQRASLAQAVADYHAIFQPGPLRSSWQVMTDELSLPFSSFNAIIQALMQAQNFTQPVSFPTSMAPRMGKTWRVQFLDTVTHVPGNEAGNFEYWQGPLSTGLVYVSEKGLHAQGFYDIPDYVAPPTPEYWQIRKGNYRTGYVLLTDPAA